MKELIKIVICICILCIMAGCSTKVVMYDMDDITSPPCNDTRQSMKVAIAPFLDSRSDHKFKNIDLFSGIATAIAQHFNKVSLFKQADAFSGSFSVPSKENLERLEELGYDALLTGKLTHYYGIGFETGFDKVAAPMAFFIPVSIVITIPIMLAEGNNHEGFVEIIDFQLTNTHTGTVIYSGMFSKKIEREYSDLDALRVANEALKETMCDVVNEITDHYNCRVQKKIADLSGGST